MGLFNFVLEEEEEMVIELPKKSKASKKKRVFSFIEEETKDAVKTVEIAEAVPENVISTDENGTEYIGTEESVETADAPDEDSSKKKYEDFGEKIGGARKDTWSKRGLMVTDLEGMNDAEREKYAVKNSVWPAIDYKVLVDNGLSRENAMRLKLIKDFLPCRKSYRATDEAYVAAITEIKAYFEKKIAENNFSDVAEFPYELGFWKKEVTQWGTSSSATDKAYNASVLNSDRYKLLQILQMDDGCLRKEIEKKKFLWTLEDEAKTDAYVFQWGEKCRVNCGRLEISNNCCHMSVYRPFGDKPADECDFSHLENGKYFVLARAGRYSSYQITTVNHDTPEEAMAAHIESFKAAHEGENFGKVTASKKAGFVPPQLEEIKREGGEDYLAGKDATEEQFLNELKFRGGEYGNWVNQEERRLNLNMCYEAIRDFEVALDLPVGAVANGTLAIAFGARGKSKALAHYEPMRKVINLTKMRGAGSLAHELMHWLDNYLSGKVNGRAGYFTENKPNQELRELLKSFKEIDKATDEWRAECKERAEKHMERDKDIFQKEVNSLLPDAELDLAGKRKRNEIVGAVLEKAANASNRLCGVFTKRKYNYYPAEFDLLSQMAKSYKGKGFRVVSYDRLSWFLNDYTDSCMELKRADSRHNFVDTEFYSVAKKLDGAYSKDSKGYWASDVELFARAGAAYIKDKLAAKGIRNDYLCGHADVSAGAIGFVSPQGEERKIINEKFDAFFASVFKEEMLSNV